MTHTPGPWEFGETEDLSVDEESQLFRSSVLGDGYETGCGYGLTVDEAEANARLIAAAPNLLEACDQAHQLLYHYNIIRQENGVDWGPVEMLQAKIIDQLWSAIIAAKPELKQ